MNPTQAHCPSLEELREKAMNRDAMRGVFERTRLGWKLVFTAQSFHGACTVARQLQEQSGVEHCVNKHEGYRPQN